MVRLQQTARKMDTGAKREREDDSENDDVPAAKRIT